MDAFDALEVAKLAASVGSQLKQIDQFSVDRTNNPANKININNFITKVKNPNASIAPARYLTDVPVGFAPPPPEHLIQQQVPDVPNTALLQQIKQEQMPTVQPQIQQQVQVEQVSIQTNKKENKIKQQVDFNLSRSDIDSIKNSLKGIDKTLSSMLDLLEKWKNNSNE